MAFGLIIRTLMITVILLTIGTTFYSSVEHLDALDAFYLSGITLTTLGYGDIVPVTPAGKIFTVIYAIVGIGTIFYISGSVFSLLINSHIKKSIFTWPRKRGKRQ